MFEVTNYVVLWKKYQRVDIPQNIFERLHTY